jgi:hypothetical protein
MLLVQLPAPNKQQSTSYRGEPRRGEEDKYNNKLE